MGAILGKVAGDPPWLCPHLRATCGREVASPLLPRRVRSCAGLDSGSACVPNAEGAVVSPEAETQNPRQPSPTAQEVLTQESRGPGPGHQGDCFHRISWETPLEPAAYPAPPWLRPAHSEFRNPSLTAFMRTLTSVLGSPDTLLLPPPPGLSLIIPLPLCCHKFQRVSRKTLDVGRGAFFPKSHRPGGFRPPPPPLHPLLCEPDRTHWARQHLKFMLPHLPV